MRSIFLVAVLLISLSANATLIDRENGMIYDDVLDITWFSDANFGAGSAFDDGANNSDGLMTWDSAADWADSLILGGFDDWRQASMDVDMDGTIVECSNALEADCQDNELGYMFYYNLMGSPFDDLTGNQGLFRNIQLIYWSGTEYAPDPDYYAWIFGFASGGRGAAPKDRNYGAWAVRDGDVGAMMAPEPATLALLSLGLAGIGLARRCR